MDTNYRTGRRAKCMVTTTLRMKMIRCAFYCRDCHDSYLIPSGVGTDANQE